MPHFPAHKVCIGQFAGSHGVRGLVKLRSFTQDPAAVAAYGPLSDESGNRRFRVTLNGQAKELWLARVEGITTREAAQALAGVRLYVDREVLPEPEDEDEFYHADLIGLTAETANGDRFGLVRAIHDFGGGDMLEIQRPDGRLEMLPFSLACVPVVDVKGGRVVVDPPTVIDAKPDDAGEADSSPAGEGEA